MCTYLPASSHRAGLVSRALADGDSYSALLLIDGEGYDVLGHLFGHSIRNFLLAAHASLQEIRVQLKPVPSTKDTRAI